MELGTNTTNVGGLGREFILAIVEQSVELGVDTVPVWVIVNRVQHRFHCRPRLAKKPGSDPMDLKDGGIPGDALFFRGYQIADGFFVQLGIVVKRWLFGR